MFENILYFARSYIFLQYYINLTNKMIDLIFNKIHNDNIEVDKKDLLSIISDSDSDDIDIISYNSWLKKYI